MGRRRTRTFKPLRSGLERTIKDQLDKSGIGYEYEPEKIDYRTRVVSGICGKCGHFIVYQKRRYTPDFVLANGIRLEVKGRLTSKDRSKLLAVLEQNPKLDLRLVFGANNKLTKNKPKRYANWASENNILFCIKEVPQSWLK